MTSQNHLESVLVTGGCGRIGSKIVKALLTEPTCTSVHVVSRNPTKNIHANANYHPGDFTNIQQITTLLDEIKPRVIIHCAAPQYLAPDKEHWQTNVIGTRALLKCTAACPTVKAFIYTSSESVIIPAEPGILQREETAKLYDEYSNIDAYSKTKAICDAEVRAANNPPTLLTTVLRLPILYGGGDDKFVVSLLENMRKGQHNMQIGEDKLKYEFVYDGKAVEAHILAVKSLLREATNMDGEYRGGRQKGKVNGEGFFISDGVSMPFFEFARKVYALAGHPVAKEEIKVMPLWFMISLATVLEWVYWIFTLGVKKPELRKQDMEHFKDSVSWRIDKAKELLGYQPVRDQDEVLKKCVESCMEHLKM
jgi:sterol-4alpha-carboxylate 3-dehydrogenase (decarboxylating)